MWRFHNLNRENSNSVCQLILVFTISFIAVCFANLPFLNMPPIWDAAAGVFAPAIYLYENNFNFSELLQSAKYLNAGPNVHSLSIITLLTYWIIKLTGGQPPLYLPTLHLIQFFFSATLLTATYNIARRLFDKLFASLIVLNLFLLPVFSVQTSYLFTEIIGSYLFVLGVYSWATRNLFRMYLFVVLACTVKDFGLVLAASLAALLLVDSSLLILRRANWAIVNIGSAFIIEMAKIGKEAITASTDGRFFGIRPVYENLKEVPDLLILVILSIIFPLLFLIQRRAFTPKTITETISSLTNGNSETRTWLGVSIMPITFTLFLATVPLTGYIFFPLPRYYVWVMPFMVLISTKTMVSLYQLLAPFQHKSLISARTFGLFLLCTVAIFSYLNRYGKFYPPGRVLYSFSIAERSYEYLNFFEVQRSGVQAMAENSIGKPLLVTRGEFYFLSSPLMGYTDKKVENLHFILTPPYNSALLSDYPPDFLILDSNSNPFHGQHIVDTIVKQALNSPKHLVQELSHFQSGQYRSILWRISLRAEPFKFITSEVKHSPTATIYPEHSNK